MADLHDTIVRLKSYANTTRNVVLVRRKTIEEAIELLKAKETPKETPMKPNGIKKHMCDMWMGWCGSCSNIVFNLHVYCPHCGQKQDWSDVKEEGEQE